MLSVAVSKAIPIFTRDISQAYVSNDTTLLRDMYLIPLKDRNLDPDVLWKAKKPLYGLPESGVHWFETYMQHNSKKWE